MKRKMIATVFLMSFALITVGCNDISSSKVQEPAVQEEIVTKKAKVVSYNESIELGVGDVLTLDKLNIVTDGDIDFTFAEKTYSEVGTFEEVVVYADGELAVNVTVVDKTAPVITGNHDIEVIEGEVIDVLDGVSTDEEATLSVSEYDITLLDTAQPVTITATDTYGNVSEVTVNLLIKTNPIEALDKMMYASSNVNVRMGTSSDTEKLGSLYLNQEVHVVGRDKSTGWYQIEFESSLGYVSSDYLSDNKTVIQTSISSGSGSSGSSTSSTSTSEQTGDSSSDSQSSSNSGGGISIIEPPDPEESRQELHQIMVDGGWYDENGDRVVSEGSWE